MLGYKETKATATAKRKKRKAPIQIVSHSKEIEEEVPPLKRNDPTT